MFVDVEFIKKSASYYAYLKRHPEKRRTNYTSGANFEQRVVNHFRTRGYFAKRNWGSHGTHIKGVSFKDDGFAFKVGIVWTAKYSKNHETFPEDHPEDIKMVKKLAKMFELTPVFAGVGADRRIKLIDLNTMKRIELK